MSTCVTLTVVEGPHKGQELTCAALAQITIGRSDDCAFRLRGACEDLLVSRRHCLIAVYPDRVDIRDLESRNGTYVNDERIGFPDSGELDGSTAFKRRLKDGDEIRVGTSMLLVNICEFAAEAAPFDGAASLPVSRAGV